MKRIFTLLCFLSVVWSACFAQLDSTYIAQYEKSTAVSFLFGKNYLMGMEGEESGSDDRSYKPNNPFSLGLGLSVYNTVINFGLSYGFDFMRNKKKGKTVSTDFQFHKYGRKFMFDVYYQKYKGSYHDDDDKLLGVFPDMKMSMYAIQGQYIFNHKKFSAPAAFNRSEKQLKSAGTFLAGFGVYNSNIQSDSIFTNQAGENFNNFQMGVNGGYAYSLIISRRWIMSGAVSAGINIGGEDINKMWNQMKVYPTAMVRVGTAYSCDNWSIGMSYVNTLTAPSYNGSKSFAVSSGSLQMNYTLRLGPIPIVSTVVNKVDRVMGWVRK